MLNKLLSLDQKRLDNLQNLAGKAGQAISEANAWCEKALSLSTKTYEKQNTDSRANYETEKSNLETEYASKIDSINQKLNSRKNEALHENRTTLDSLNAESNLIETELGLLGQGWDSPDWEKYKKPTRFELPLFTRFGLLTISNGFSSITTPALLPVIGGKNVLIKAKGVGKEKARLVIQSLVLRLLATVPPNKLTLLCIDPVQLGATVAGFIKGLPEITGNMAWYNQNDIENKLTELESHIAYVKQKYLGVTYATIEEYNTSAGQIEEPYRLLVVSDFPNRFTESSAQRLVSIATTGISAGVYTIVMNDEDQPKPHGFVLTDLERTATILHCEEEKSYLHDENFKDITTLLLDSPPSVKHFESLVDAIKKATSETTGLKIPFVLPQKEDWWAKENDSRIGISAPIGQFEARDQQYFSFDEKLLNSALVIGVSGSGKSTLLHTIISGLTVAYSPSELELYLLDCKQVEFKEYAKFKLPHAQVVAIHSGRDFGLSVLKKINFELENRERIFKAADVKSLSKYRNIQGNNMPRILLIVDEFQELFSNDDAIARTAEQILDRLIRLGRALGIHVLLASQSLSGKNTISQTVVEQIAIRIALKLRSDSESRRVLSDGNDAARYLNRSGEAIYNDQNGLKEHNRRFQVYWFDEEERQSFLKKLRLLADDSDFSEKSPIVFDGDAPAFIQDNRELLKAISDPYWPTLKRGHAAKAWLGAPTEIKEQMAITFKRQSSSNLLVIGEKEYEERVIGVLMSSLISLASQQNQKHAKFFIFNVTDVEDLWHDLPVILKALPHEVDLITRDKAKSAIKTIGDELEARRKKDKTDDPAIYIAFFGLQYISSLRMQDKKSSLRSFSKDKGDDGSNEQPAHEILYNILRYGPEKGIHTLLWCNRYADLRQILDNDVRELCDMRVIFQASESDSRAIIDSDTATKLGSPNRAILYDRHKSSIEKFIPYEPPSLSWLELQVKNLESKQDKQ